jgi:hypothetical protein
MSNETKQTAVEWLAENTPLGDSIFFVKQVQQAKEMEKEQIINAFQEGIEIPYIEIKGDRTLFIKPIDTSLDAENYYNETYGGNK